MKTLLIGAVVSASIASAAFGDDKPITLKAIGSFYVGGRRIEIKHSGGIGSKFPDSVPVLLQASAATAT